MAGIGFVSLSEGFTIEAGDGWTLACGVLFAVHMVAISKYGKDKDPIQFAILQFGFSAAFEKKPAILFVPSSEFIPYYRCFSGSF